MRERKPPPPPSFAPPGESIMCSPGSRWGSVWDTIYHSC